MKIPVIKQLVEKYSIEELKKAETDIENGDAISIEIEGEDEGEQLTHAIASAWILEKMQEDNLAFKDALRLYTSKVRSSIN